MSFIRTLSQMGGQFTRALVARSYAKGASLPENPSKPPNNSSSKSRRFFTCWLDSMEEGSMRESLP